MLYFLGFIALAFVLIFLLNTKRWKKLSQGVKGVRRELEDELRGDDR